MKVQPLLESRRADLWILKSEHGLLKCISGFALNKVVIYSGMFYISKIEFEFGMNIIFFMWKYLC